MNELTELNLTSGAEPVVSAPAPSKGKNRSSRRLVSNMPAVISVRCW